MPAFEKMKLSSVGIVLLTLMVGINFYLNESNFTKSDGSFKNGITLDRSHLYSSLLELKANQKLDAELYAYSSFSQIKLSDWLGYVERENPSEVKERGVSFTKKDDPISVEQVNSLVVYDMNNPEKNIIATKYEDFVDDIPLDNSNTIVSGLMQIMPRK